MSFIRRPRPKRVGPNVAFMLSLGGYHEFLQHDLWGYGAMLTKFSRLTVAISATVRLPFYDYGYRRDYGVLVFTRREARFGIASVNARRTPRAAKMAMPEDQP